MHRWKNVTRSRYKWKFLENLERISNITYEEDRGENIYLLLIKILKNLGSSKMLTTATTIMEMNAGDIYLALQTC